MGEIERIRCAHCQRQIVEAKSVPCEDCGRQICGKCLRRSKFEVGECSLHTNENSVRLLLRWQLRKDPLSQICEGCYQDLSPAQQRRYIPAEAPPPVCR